VANRCVFFKLKMQQNRFRPGSAPDPAGGDHDARPDSLVGCGGGRLIASRFWPPPMQIPGYGLSNEAPIGNGI